MTKAMALASALWIGAAAFGPLQAASAADAKSADATKKAQCEREAALQHYTGRQRNRFIRQCLAKNRRSPGKDEARRPVLPPPGPPATPKVAPLASPRSTFTGGTVPSNAPVAPSAPVIGSRGTSTTGSSATSISGSSGTSIGGSGGR